ncbi:MAG: M23 family metallopeptidase [Sedimentibacter sp.]|uniref:M23 family metallopeptidase n=1 Tax=Sedimentibacter sp. TaxID=1960295 RepID=UPI0031583C9F
MNKIPRKRISIKRKENFNRKLALQVVFSIVLVAAVIVAKNMESDASRKFINAAEEKISQSLKLDELKNTVEEFASSVVDRMPFAKSSSDFTAPVSGQIYKEYGLNKDKDQSYYNHGLDIISDTQTVKSMSSGTVIQIGNNEKLSDYVVVESDGKTIIYGQIKEAFVSEGEKVAAGDIIASLSEAERHLHLEVWEGGESLNPAKLFDLKD